MRSNWPKKTEREEFEIAKFISAYARLSKGRRFVVHSKQETPDYFLKDSATGEIFGVELTSVYLNDRSVPDEHMKPVNGLVEVPYDPDAIELYNSRLIASVESKVQKSRKHFNTSHPLILAIYINEYISIHLENSDLEKLVRTNESLFDAMKPFTEVVLWNLANEGAMSITPKPEKSMQRKI